jgi:hypothetical protein
MTKRLVAIYLVLVALLAVLVPSCSPQETYPSDLRIEAFAGGFAPWTSLYMIQIYPDGSGVYSQEAPENRGNATWTQISSFNLTAGQMKAIWDEINANSFFSLGQNYSTPAWDGSFAVMSITANGVTYKVVTENTEVQAFDSIVMAINDATPGDLDLFYNAINPIGALSDLIVPLAAGDYTSGTINGCSITITIKIELYGPGANATAVKQDIETYWNQGDPHVKCPIPPCPLKDPGCSVKFSADVQTRNETAPPTPGYYQVKVFNSSATGCAFSVVYMGNPPTGLWYAAALSKTYAHETGHLTGEGDAYNRTAGADGQMLTADDVVTPLAGHENDLMASVAKCTEVPSQDSISGIVNRTGIICPCECCPE